MALIECPECKKMISEQASSCPGCGFPIKKALGVKHDKLQTEKSKGKTVGVLLIISCIFVLLGVLGTIYILKMNPFGKYGAKRIDYDGLGISKECYLEVKEIMNSYQNADFQERIEDLYIDYRTSRFDNESVKKQISTIKYEAKDKYAKLYEIYENEKDKSIVLFGYNFTMLCIDQARAEAMKITDDVDYNELINEYYGIFMQDPSEININSFIAKYPGTYTKKLSLMTEKDVAELIDIKLNQFSLSLAQMESDFKESQYSLSYVHFEEAIGYLKEALDIASENDAYTSSFVSGNIIEIKVKLDKVLASEKTMVNAIHSQPGEDYAISCVSSFQSELTYIEDLYIEVRGNVNEYIK